MLMEKLQQIEKIKHMLLNDDQIILFDFFPKPVITLNEDKYKRLNRIELEEARRNNWKKEPEHVI